ncbi:MAG: hypothetical protein LQ346_004503 [Caloplaca aetnensis]|nr:MAG: hypothetical protein LQ346_004503 [Caloplaca aetnensis]
MREVITSTNLTAADAPLWNTAEHHGSVISVVTWLLIIATVLVVVARVVTRYATTNTLQRADILAILAMVTAIGQSIAVSISSTNGLGSHADTLRPDQKDVIQKALYASLLIYVVTLGLAKSSVCIHLYNLFPYRASRQFSTVLMSLIGIWTTTALLVIAFECKLPNPWSITSSGKCIDLLAFGTYYGIFNIITDIALIALPVSIVIKLQMRASQKAVIIACDASRLSAIVAQILQLAYLHTNIAATQTPDLIYDLWVPILLGQTVLSFSLISSCFPLLKFLIDALETGMIRADGQNITHAQLRLPSVNRSADGYSRARGSQFQKAPFSSNSEAGTTAPAASRWGGRKKDASKTAPKDIEMDWIERSSHGLPNRHFEITAGKKSDDNSQNSQTHIMRKVEWSVTEEKSGVAP